MMERRNRLEERIAALMAARLHSGSNDNTPMLLAFVTRALHDTAYNAWYDHETDDVAGLIDGLIARLRAVVGETRPATARRAAHDGSRLRSKPGRRAAAGRS
jgi:transcriptional regulator MftR-like protein